jgi:hypothetical protein
MNKFNRLATYAAVPVAAVSLTAGCGDDPNQEFEVTEVQAVAKTKVYYWEDKEGRLPFSGNYQIISSEPRVECIDKSEDEANFFGFYDGDDGCDNSCSGFSGSDCKAREYTHYTYTLRRSEPELELMDTQSAESANMRILDLRPPEVSPIYHEDTVHWSIDESLILTAQLTDASDGDYDCAVDANATNETNNSNFRKLQMGMVAVGREKLNGKDPNWIEFTALDQTLKVDCM